jgi:hypothetical protein
MRERGDKEEGETANPEQLNSEKRQLHDGSERAAQVHT